MVPAGGISAPPGNCVQFADDIICAYKVSLSFKLKTLPISDGYRIAEFLNWGHSCGYKNVYAFKVLKDR